MSVEERRFMWNLAFSFTIAHRGAAFKAYYSIRSFITFHGIFMGRGYGVGDRGVLGYIVMTLILKTHRCSNGFSIIDLIFYHKKINSKHYIFMTEKEEEQHNNR